MDIKIMPRPLQGTVRAISSKSHAHRLLLATAISEIQHIGKEHEHEHEQCDCDHGHDKHEHEHGDCGCEHHHGHHNHEQHAHGCCHGEALPQEHLLTQIRELRDAVLNKVHIDDWNEDLEATKNCICQLLKDSPLFDCGESGSTLRFMLPIAMALKSHALFCGSGRLPYRPISPLKEEMEGHGCGFILPQEYLQHTVHNFADSENNTSDKLAGSEGRTSRNISGSENHASNNGSKESILMAIVNGKLQSGHYKLPGNVSSQYITGLLFALPLLDGDSTLEITSPLESSGYVALTLDVLHQFGIAINTSLKLTLHGPSYTYLIPGNQTYVFPVDTTKNYAPIAAEGDWSNAAFWIVASAINESVHCRGTSSQNSIPRKADPDTSKQEIASTVVCTNLNPSSSQGDKQIVEFVDIVKKNINNDATLTFDVAQVPDLVPILSVLACAREKGTTHIINAGRLRIKESDRLATVREMLEALGANITEGEDSLTIIGNGKLQGGTVNGHNDHRIVMAAAIASILCTEPVTILGSQAVNKSYPNFWHDFASLGGEHIEL